MARRLLAFLKTVKFPPWSVRMEQNTVQSMSSLPFQVFVEFVVVTLKTYI